MASQNTQVALKRDGSNLYDLSLEMADWRDGYQAKIEERRIWHVQGGEKAMRKFFLWKKFPHEVKIKIFEYACYEPRIVEVNLSGETVSSPTPLPSVMHACAESREAASKVYEPLKIPGFTTDIYINWSVDVVFIKNAEKENTWAGLLDIELLSKCQHLAVDFGAYPVTPEINSDGFGFGLNVPIKFEKLDTMIMISGFDISNVHKHKQRSSLRIHAPRNTFFTRAMVLQNEADEELDELIKRLSVATEHQDDATEQPNSGNITFTPASTTDETEMALLRSLHASEQHKWESEGGMKFVFRNISRGPVRSADERAKRLQRTNREAENQRVKDPVYLDEICARR
jgi:hypothetical protein